MKLSDQPEISFESLSFQINTKKTPFSLYPLLFPGGAGSKSTVPWLPPYGSTLDKDRIGLVLALHEEIRARQIMGASDRTITRYLYGIRNFFTWADEEQLSLNLSSLKNRYIRYANGLLLRHRTVGDIKESSAFAMASTLSAIFDSVLDLKNGLLRLTQLRKPKSQPSYVKEKLASLDRDGMRMGGALLAISKGIHVESLAGPLPLKIEYEPGNVLSIGKPRCPIFREADGSVSIERIRLDRRHILNFRTDAELLIFVSQTSMNLEQALNLQIQDFYIPNRPRTGSDTISVRAFKARKGGEALFEIFPAYRNHFIRYLDFRKLVIDDEPTGPLFKFLPRPSANNPLPKREVVLVKKAFLKHGIPYRTARQLRRLRGNFLKEHTGDAEIAAEMGSHSLETFNSAYTKVDVNKALREVAMFHKKNDPAISPPGPGLCANKDPTFVKGSSQSAPTPDCVKPAGCLFCVNQRDISSFDHIWSLTCFRYLKQIELSKDRGKSARKNPAFLVVERVSEKLTAICDSPETSAWLFEATARVQEGHYHPYWHALIELAEKTV